MRTSFTNLFQEQQGYSVTSNQIQRCVELSAVSDPTRTQIIPVRFAIILVGFEADLSFLPPQLVAEMLVDPTRPVDGKANVITIEPSSGHVLFRHNRVCLIF